METMQTTTHVTVDILADAIAVCEGYITAADQAYAGLKAQVASLKANGAFIGEASDGYDEAFAELTPFITTDLTDKGNPNAVMSVLIQMINSFREIIMEQQDPALGRANRDFVSNTPAAAEPITH